MLLPSPLPSEPFLPPPQPTRPALKPTGAYQPQPQSTTSTLLASCRALQHVLSTTPLSCQSKPPQLLPSRTTTSQPTRAPLQPISPIQHNPKKRRRDDYESDGLSSPGPELNQENNHPSTPKRRRRIPLCMPLGLSAADFRSLQTPPREAIPVQLDMPISNSKSPADFPTPTSITSTWTPADDSALVSTVLEKLALSRHEWNDCARILGKDQDSLGRRWRILVGDGEVGLRRGGRRERGRLEVGSW
jgi:hypothetical protein